MAISLLHRNTDMVRLGCRIMVVLLFLYGSWFFDCEFLVLYFLFIIFAHESDGLILGYLHTLMRDAVYMLGATCTVVWQCLCGRALWQRKILLNPRFQELKVDRCAWCCAIGYFIQTRHTLVPLINSHNDFHFFNRTICHIEENIDFQNINFFVIIIFSLNKSYC